MSRGFNPFLNEKHSNLLTGFLFIYFLKKYRCFSIEKIGVPNTNYYNHPELACTSYLIHPAHPY